MDPTENTASNSSSIVACVSVAVVISILPESLQHSKRLKHWVTKASALVLPQDNLIPTLDMLKI
jgi:hypothetical protein